MAPATVRWSAAALLTGSTLASCLLVYRAPRPYAATLPLLAVAFGGLAVVALLPALRHAVSGALVVVLSIVALTSSIVTPPPRGADMWVYHQYGRIIVEHHENPYVHPPSDHPEDPWVQDIQLYRDDRSPFGPVYMAMTAAVALIGRDSHLVVRLAYQLGAALAVAGCALLMARASVPPWRIALLTLNPVVLIEVVGQGRVDAYVGLALLSAALAATARPRLAAVFIAIAALIKLPAILPLAALVVWVWRRAGRREAIVVGASGAAPILLAYLAVGGRAALEPLLAVRTIANDVNIWVLARENGIARTLGDLDAVLGPVGATSTLATIAAVVLATVLLLARLDDRVPALVLASPLLAYLLTSTYPTARYAVWVLPLLLLKRPSSLVISALTLSASILALTQYNAARHVARGDTEITDYLIPLEGPTIRVLHGLPILVELAAITVLLVSSARALARRASATT